MKFGKIASIVHTVTAGNGSERMSVDIELNDMIIGEAEYLFHTFDMKYTETKNTKKNMKPKNMLKVLSLSYLTCMPYPN